MYTYPYTEKMPVVEERFGHVLREEYRWLEKIDDPHTQAWMQQQNVFTNKILQEHANLKQIHATLEKYTKVDFVGLPVMAGNYIFWSEHQYAKKQAILYVRKVDTEEKQILLDLNEINPDGTTALDYWYISPNTTYIAYGLSNLGSQLSTLYIMHIATRKRLPDIIPYARNSEVAWTGDEEHFFYTRLPTPSTVSHGDEHYYQHVYKHTLGQSFQNDICIFGQHLAKEYLLSIRLEDEKHLIVTASKDWVSDEVYLVDTQNDTYIPIIHGVKARCSLAYMQGKLILKTNYKAPNGTILYAHIDKLPKSLDEWTILVPETKAVLQNFTFIRQYLVLSYLFDVSSQLQLYDLMKKAVRAIRLPAKGIITGLATNAIHNTLLFSFESFLIHNTVYEYSIDDDRRVVYSKSESFLDTSLYTVQQWFYESHDHTRIPLFLIYKRTIPYDGNRPTILYGYGGFSQSITPVFLNYWMPFLEKGGIMAIANVRGGGEYGSTWHEQGMLRNKKNCFDDFIAAAEYLINRKYTNPKKLAFLGGSSGGLLAGASMVMRPDLCKAAVCNVPVLDMIHFPEWYIGSRWIGEYGNPRHKLDFPYLLSYSPYHNVLDGVEYPAVLLTTAYNDRNVSPAHAFKMAARLQDVNKDNVVLLRTDTEAGHGKGNSRESVINQQQDILAFLFWQLGM